jgi:hypothetical protein
MNKRGLSDIVATVLIVLLALAAVALIWGFLKPAFEDTGSQIDLRTKCLSVEVEPTQCIFEDNYRAMVTVKMASGEAAKVYAVIQYDDNSANSSMQDAPPLLATTNIVIMPPAANSKPLTAKVAGIVVDEQGNQEVCAESTKIECEQVDNGTLP